MQKVIDKSWNYVLYKSDEDYLLDVLCGSVGMYQLKIWLNTSEKESYLLRGEDYIDELARTIQRNPSSFKERSENKP